MPATAPKPGAANPDAAAEGPAPEIGRDFSPGTTAAESTGVLTPGTCLLPLSAQHLILENDASPTPNPSPESNLAVTPITAGI
jgi:hypothetical protein